MNQRLREEMTVEQLRVIDRSVADYFNAVGSRPKIIKMNLNTEQALVRLYVGNSNLPISRFDTYRGMKVVIFEDLNYGEVQLEGKPWHENIED